jgi:hypothetical protein
MECHIKWTDVKNTQKKILFNKYIIDRIEENDKDMEDGIIDILTYNKNKFLLKTLKKDEVRYKKFKDEDVIIENNIIDKIKSLEKNDNGLIYFKDNKLKQTKITDYNKHDKNNKNTTTKYNDQNYKMGDGGNPVFLIQ